MTSDSHPGDEVLSAALDGEEAMPPHVARCPRCQGRLAQLRAAVAAVAGPVPQPPSAALDSALGRALDADDVVPMKTRRSRLALTSAVAAAVLVVLGAAVGWRVVAGGGKTRTASPSGAETAGGQATRGAVGPVVNGGDLGDLGDAATLQARVRPAVIPTTTPAAASQQGQRPAGSPPPSPTVPVPTPAPCELQARVLDPGQQRLVYLARVRWKGQEAQVLGFAAEGGSRPGAVRVYVMAQADCRLLEFQAYSP